MGDGVCGKQSARLTTSAVLISASIGVKTLIDPTVLTGCSNAAPRLQARCLSGIRAYGPAVCDNNTMQ